MEKLPIRLTKHVQVAKKLQALDKAEIMNLLETAQAIGSGIGGPVSFFDLEGTQVFVKKVRLTDIERNPENWGSTRNVFDLPLYYQYGVGSAGFGAWRELAAHNMATDWVRNGDCPNFPLLYHSRVLERSKHESELNSVETENYVSDWNNSPAVRVRVEAGQNSTADIVLFLEYFPQTLARWFEEQVALGGEAARLAIATTEKQLFAASSFMNSRGLFHFDAHHSNILTDGEQLYVSDFGLATSLLFDLTRAEIEFVHRHRDYDKSYAAMVLVGGILHSIFPEHQESVMAILLKCANSTIGTELPLGIAPLFRRYAPVAALMVGFMEGLKRDKTLPYPAEALRRACTSAGLI